jgi:hypothetical protein
MASVEEGVARHDAARVRVLSTREVVMELARKASQLARKEVALAKSEAREDLKTEIRMASGLGVAGVCALFTVNLLLVAIVFALSEAQVMSGWLASLLVAAVVLAIGTVAGLVAWKRRVRQPLDTTRKSVQDNVRWAKERIS